MPLDSGFTPRHYDPHDDLAVVERRLPHWAQNGAIVFLTWRTWDSMPKPVLGQLDADRAEWLRLKGGDPARPTLSSDLRAYRFERWEGDLDRGYGACPLRSPRCSAVVADALHHFDGVRYVLFDFVVMPNHVHVLATFPEAGAMRKQCESWKHYTARQLNAILGRTGRFWQEESFDHLTRSDGQLEHLRDYIADNPNRAGLTAGEYCHYSRDLPSSARRVARRKPLAERAGHSPDPDQTPLAERAGHSPEADQ